MDGKKIFVVDDDAALRTVIKLKLEAAGYAVVVCDTPSSALLQAANQQVDLVLLDIRLGTLNGFDILEKMRKTRATMNLPVLMLSARNSREDIERAANLAASGYILKPIDYDILLKKISALLDEDPKHTGLTMP